MNIYFSHWSFKVYTERYLSCMQPSPVHRYRRVPQKYVNDAIQHHTLSRSNSEGVTGNKELVSAYSKCQGTQCLHT